MAKGYLSSGRAMADYWGDEFRELHRYARWCIRNGLIDSARYELRQARRALRNFRHFRERIDA